MASAAIEILAWPDVWSGYAALLTANPVVDSSQVEAMARSFIEAEIPYAEFDAGHAALVKAHCRSEASQKLADQLRQQILSTLDEAFAAYRGLQKRYRAEAIEIRHSAQIHALEAERLASSRADLATEVAQQNRLLNERSVELEALNAKLLAQRDEMAGFLYSISHDLKSPINTIQSLLAFFLEDNADRDMDVSDVENATQTASRTLSMLDDLFKFSRTLDGPDDTADVNLNKLIADIFDDLAEADPDRRPCFEKDKLPIVNGSEFQLRLLFQNLIANGAKFCPPDRMPEVRVVSAGTRGLTHTAIAVTDNGIGIDPAYHKKVFGLFNRLHAYGDFPGTGIGLALCDRVVRNHGGQIDLRSEPGKGATFVVTLPI